MTNYFHCPRRGCRYHIDPPKNDKWYHFFSTYETKVSGTVKRYICNSCGKTFSHRTFSIDYYTKKNIDYKELLDQQISASGINDMARHMNCTTETVQNRIRRMAHQIMGAMAIHLKDLKLSEDVAADGLESFVESQFFPTNIDILVGQRSQFIYFFDAYYFKRKGKMTDKQKKTAKTLYQEVTFKRGMATKTFLQLLDFLDKIWDRTKLPQLTLNTDQHPIYPIALKKQKGLFAEIESQSFSHVQTNSKKARTIQNPLFPCNYCDRMVRKDLAEHVRETVQFARDQNFSMERFTLYQFWLNFLKPYRIKPTKNTQFITHSEAAGISDEVSGNILSRVWYGNRIEWKDVANLLTPFQKEIWMTKIDSPTGKKDRRLPKFMVS